MTRRSFSQFSYENPKKHMVFPNDFESVLRIDWRKIRKMRRDMVAAAFGRRHHVPSHFSYFSAVNSETHSKSAKNAHVFQIFNFWENDVFLKHIKKSKRNDVFSPFATPHLIGLVVRILCGADICLEDACIPFSEAF